MSRALELIILQSYGGFMSSKVVEADAGVHSLAMAIAVSTLDIFMADLTHLHL